VFLQTPQPAPPETPVAQDVRVAQPEPSWTFVIEPFIWFAGLDGQGEAGTAPPVDIGLSATDVFGHFDAGFLLAFEARAPADRWSIMADGLYLRLKDEEGAADTETEATMIELGGALPLSDSGRFDLIAGLRYVDLSFDVQIGAPIDQTARETWVDPWIGARGIIPISESWAVHLRGDAGGFGVGSQFSWQALGIIAAQLGAGWRFDVGYRAIGIDYNDGDLSFDTRVHGPLIGFAWQG
jgi:hypothetical protein